MLEGRLRKAARDYATREHYAFYAMPTTKMTKMMILEFLEK
jgi:hypothetical protein